MDERLENAIDVRADGRPVGRAIVIRRAQRGGREHRQ